MLKQLYDNKSNNLKLATVVISPLLIFLLGELVFRTGFKVTDKKILGTYSTIILLSIILYFVISESNSPNRQLFELLDKIGHVSKNQNEILNDEGVKNEQKHLKQTTFYIIGTHLFIFFLVLFMSVFNGYKTGHKIRSIMMFFMFGVMTLCSLSYFYERLLVYKYSGNRKHKITFKDYFINGVNLNYENPKI